jgi:phosphonate transport system substrate-binding protein
MGSIFNSHAGRRTPASTITGALTAATSRLVLGLGVVLMLAGTVARAHDLPESPPNQIQPRDDTPKARTPSLYGSDLEAPNTLGVGRIARNVGKHLPALEAVARWLEPGAADLGFDKVRPVIARDNAEMVDFLERGIVDLVSETPLSALHFVEKAGATLLLRERRTGRDEYRSVILVRDDSPIRSLADLASRRIACEDAGSTTAFLLPLAAIKRAGLRTVEIDDVTEPPVEGAVAYFFAQSETSILTAVSRGVADAGAMSDDNWKDFLQDKPGPAGMLRVLHESSPVPRAFVLAGPRTTQKQRDGLRELLLTMANDRRGIEVLERYDDINGFDPIGSVLEGQIAELGEIHALVREELE